jgi:hypothetical protein
MEIWKTAQLVLYLVADSSLHFTKCLHQLYSNGTLNYVDSWHIPVKWKESCTGKLYEILSMVYLK